MSKLDAKIFGGCHQINCTDANGLKDFFQINCTDANGLKDFFRSIAPMQIG
jgi:hypothetical protein